MKPLDAVSRRAFRHRSALAFIVPGAGAFIAALFRWHWIAILVAISMACVWGAAIGRGYKLQADTNREESGRSYERIRIAIFSSNTLGAVLLFVALIAGEDELLLLAAPFILLGAGGAVYEVARRRRAR